MTTRTETWNGERHFPLTGNYFELLETSAPVDVKAWDAGGHVVNDESQVESGFWIDRRGREPYVRLSITTGSSHAVKFSYSDGSAGNRAVPADITSDAARLLGIVYGNLGQLAQLAVGGVNALQVTERGIAYGAAFASVTALASVTNEQVLAPGSNVNGVIVWDAELFTANGTGHALAALLAKASAPASMIDSDVLLMSGFYNLSGVGVGGMPQRLARPVLVAAGKGLYFRNGSATAESLAYRKVLYTVL